jgi:hypothetical protein
MTIREFEKTWEERILKDYLKSFPDEYIDESVGREVKMPGKVLTMGSELFGSHEVVDSEGVSHFTVPNYLEAKYIIYANRTMPPVIVVPDSEDKLNEAVKVYESFLDTLLKRIESDFKSEFPDSKESVAVTNRIFSSLNLQRY